MIRNYLLVALRNFSRNRIVTTINIFGLAMAMTATLIILQYVMYHLSFDRAVLGDWKYIHRMGYDWHWTDSKGHQHLEAPGAWGDIVVRLETEFPEIEWSTWFTKGLYHRELFDESENRLWVHPDNRFERDPLKVANFISADSNYFKVFDFPLIGQPDEVLAEPNTAVVSANLAHNLFSTSDAIGKMVYIDGKRPIKITGVYDPGKQSTLDFDLILSVPKRHLDVIWSYENFFKTQPGTDVRALYHKIALRFPEYHAASLEQFSNVSAEAFPFFQTMDEVHFDRYANLEVLSNVTYPRAVFYVLLIIGFIISGIAMANYFNLTSAQLISRVREIGVRKVIGASGWSLFLQSLIESILIMLLAFIFALTISQLIQPYLNTIGIEMEDNYLLNQWWFFPLIGCTVFLTSAFTAAFKTFLLNRVSISSIFRGTVAAEKLSTKAFQKVLLGVQFMCTVGLIIGIVIVHRQVGYIMDLDKGYTASNTIVIQAPEGTTSHSKIRPFMNAIERLGEVEDLSASRSYPGETGQLQNAGLHYRPGKKETYGLDGNGPAAANFAEFFEVEIVAGRNFREAYPPDLQAILLSEHAVQRLEFKSNEEALNAVIHQNYGTEADSSQHNSYRVIGVFKDYYVYPLHEIQEDRGMVLTLADEAQPTDYRHFYVKTRGQEFHQLLKEIKSTYSNFFVNTPFDFFILGETQRSDYAKDELLRSIFLIFTALAIVISFLGLFALLSLLLLKKTKEIGIRKIMGASMAELFPLYAKGYVQLLLVTSFIAVPIIWWLANEWLNGYAVRIELSWIIFVLPVLALIGLMLVLLFTQIYRVTRVNPCESLRYE